MKVPPQEATTRPKPLQPRFYDNEHGLRLPRLRSAAPVVESRRRRDRT